MVIRVCVAPLFECLKGLCKNEVMRLKINVLHMEHFQSRDCQLILRIEGEVGISSLSDHFYPFGLRVSAALRVVKNIQLEVSQSHVQLFFKRFMLVLKSLGSFGAHATEVAEDLGRHGIFVAIVATNDLRLVEGLRKHGKAQQEGKSE